ncbi:hypothetical protein [Bacillus smithii]|uniref:hypothetical protein n=1 Tax=Bacillus smithii TaxID=1479 RepID=UPI0030C9F7B7
MKKKQRLVKKDMDSTHFHCYCLVNSRNFSNSDNDIFFEIEENHGYDGKKLDFRIESKSPKNNEIQIIFVLATSPMAEKSQTIGYLSPIDGTVWSFEQKKRCMLSAEATNGTVLKSVYPVNERKTFMKWFEELPYGTVHYHPFVFGRHAVIFSFRFHLCDGESGRGTILLFEQEDEENQYSKKDLREKQTSISKKKMIL